MKIRCINKFNPNTGEESENGWVSTNREYVVLEIYIKLGQYEEYRIISDSGDTPVIIPSKGFEIVSSKIPESWIVQMHNERSLCVRPHEFAVSGFWKKYFDDDLEAMSTFDRVYKEQCKLEE